jgi:hypothetical protein
VIIEVCNSQCWKIWSCQLYIVHLCHLLLRVKPNYFLITRDRSILKENLWNFPVTSTISFAREYWELSCVTFSTENIHGKPALDWSTCKQFALGFALHAWMLWPSTPWRCEGSKHTLWYEVWRILVHCHKLSSRKLSPYIIFLHCKCVGPSTLWKIRKSYLQWQDPWRCNGSVQCTGMGKTKKTQRTEPYPTVVVAEHPACSQHLHQAPPWSF